jgi:hypothetical protein
VPPMRRLSAGQTAASRRSSVPATACSSAPIPFAQPQGRADPDHHPFVLTPDAEPCVVIADAVPDPGPVLRAAGPISSSGRTQEVRAPLPHLWLLPLSPNLRA